MMLNSSELVFNTDFNFDSNWKCSFLPTEFLGAEDSGVIVILGAFRNSVKLGPHLIYTWDLKSFSFGGIGLRTPCRYVPMFVAEKGFCPYRCVV